MYVCPTRLVGMSHAEADTDWLLETVCLSVCFSLYIFIYVVFYMTTVDSFLHSNVFLSLNHHYYYIIQTTVDIGPSNHSLEEKKYIDCL